MKLNYKSLGNFIELVDLRNKYDINPQSIDAIKGISSISKSFIKTKANLVGVKPDNYKVIKPGQFGFNPNTARMGDRIPIALNTGKNNVLVSSIYPTFKIIDSNLLLSEYLLCGLNVLNLIDMLVLNLMVLLEKFLIGKKCVMLNFLSHPEKQRKIVEEYNTIVNRMKLNEQLNQKLEETAQALYKQWFVDFEFPNYEGKPYKSTNGKMIYNDKLNQEIPYGWIIGQLSDISKIVMGQSPNSTSYNNKGNGEIFYQGRTEFDLGFLQ